jgi:hypothetical protein
MTGFLSHPLTKGARRPYWRVGATPEALSTCPTCR